MLFFIDVSLQLCLNHTLSAFRHDVTCENMVISGSERDTCLAILRDMLYSSDEVMYHRNMERLEAVGCNPVLEYVRSSWHDIRSQWVEGLKEQHLTLGETTMQRLESVGTKMKGVCCEIASLQQFFVEFRSFLTSMRAECTHRAMMMFTRKPTAAVADDLLPYRDCLTPYAFRMVHQQYTESLTLGTCSEVDENVDTYIFASATGTDTTRLGCCSCRLNTSRRLPCKHLLYVRRLRAVEFDESVFDSRWKRADYVNHCQLNLPNGGTADLEFLDANNEEEDSSGGIGKQSEEQRRVEQAEKYRKARHMTDQIASQCAKAGMAVFSSRMTLLQMLYDCWSKGTEATLLKVETAEDTPPATRKRGRPPKIDGKTQTRQSTEKRSKLVGRPKSRTKTKQKYHQSSDTDDDDIAAVDGDVEADDDDEQTSGSGDVNAMLLAMAADNGTCLSATNNDEAADFDGSASAEDGGPEDLAADADNIADIADCSPVDDGSYVIVPEDSALLADVAQNRVELRPLDAVIDIQLPSPPVRKRGRPKKTVPAKLEHHQKLKVNVVVKQEVTSAVGRNGELR